MNINELNAKEYEFCKDEEDAFQADPTVRNQVVVLCKRDEFKEGQSISGGSNYKPPRSRSRR